MPGRDDEMNDPAVRTLFAVLQRSRVRNTDASGNALRTLAQWAE